MNADINEISANTAEVVLWDNSWFNGVTVTATIELDGGHFWKFISAGICINDDCTAPVDFAFLAEFEPVINRALDKYDADRRVGEE